MRLEVILLDMPTWGELLVELGQNKLPNGMPDFDGIRRKYLVQ